MITPQELSGGGRLEYGYGLVVRESDQGQMIFHNGATAGFTSFFAYYPEHDLSIVLLTNTDGFNPPLEAVASLLVSRL